MKQLAVEQSSLQSLQVVSSVYMLGPDALLTSEADYTGLFFPTVVLTHLHHSGEDVVPDLLAGHGVVGEHAAVPADVFEFLGDFAFFVAHPITGVAGDVEFAVRIGREAMTARLVM